MCPIKIGKYSTTVQNTSTILEIAISASVAHTLEIIKSETILILVLLNSTHNLPRLGLTSMKLTMFKEVSTSVNHYSETLKINIIELLLIRLY